MPRAWRTLRPTAPTPHGTPLGHDTPRSPALVACLLDLSRVEVEGEGRKGLYSYLTWLNCPSIRPFTHPSIFPSIQPTICPLIYPSSHPFIQPFAHSCIQSSTHFSNHSESGLYTDSQTTWNWKCSIWKDNEFEPFMNNIYHRWSGQKQTTSTNVVNNKGGSIVPTFRPRNVLPPCCPVG